MTLRLKVYSDGASRGNPGPSAIAFKIVTEDGKTLREDSKYLGIKTNNQAEYQSLIYALKSASDFTSKETIFHMDSELVVKQLTGEYRVRTPHLKTLWKSVQRLKQKLPNVSFKHVPRTETHIQEVDSLANKILDENLRRKDAFNSQ